MDGWIDGWILYLLVTLCPEGFPTQVTLVRLLSAVDPQVHVEVVLLGEGVATQAAHKRTLVPVKVGTQLKARTTPCRPLNVSAILGPVNGFDVHLQAVSTGRSVATLLAHKRLLAAMLRRFVNTQLRPGQEGFGTLGTLEMKRRRRRLFQYKHLEV